VSETKVKNGTGTVTLITPVFNQAQFVAETIDSVVGQAGPRLHYIVVDDGSTDASWRVIGGYSGQVEVVQQPNRGQAATLNAAWEGAKTPYLSYLSGDDLLYPGAIAACVEVLDANPETVAAFPDCELIDTAGRVLRRGVCRPFDLVDATVRHRCFIGPGAVFRADAFRAAGGWQADLRFQPDREFWLRLALIGPISFVPRVLAGYRVHKGALSRSVAPTAADRERRLILERFLARADVPAEVRARGPEAIARLDWLAARDWLRAGNPLRALKHLAFALHAMPGLATPTSLHAEFAEVARNRLGQGPTRRPHA